MEIKRDSYLERLKIRKMKSELYDFSNMFS